MKRWFCAVVGVATLLLGAVSTAFADVDADLIVGHGGRAIANAATPVVVTLRSTETQAVTLTLDLAAASRLSGSGVGATRTIVLPGGGTRRELFFVAGPSDSSAFQVRITAGTRVTIVGGQRRGDRGELTLTSSSGRGGTVYMGSHVIAVAGDSRAFPLVANQLPFAQPEAGPMGLHEADRIEVLEFDRELLAMAPFALDGVETLLVIDPDSEFASTERETTALLDWVALGGRLVVSLGDHSSQFASSALAAELPARWGRTGPADFVDLAERMGVSWDAGDRPRAAPGVTVTLTPRSDVGAVTEPKAGFVSRAFGQGEITVFAYDLRGVLMLPHKENLPAKVLADAVLIPTITVPGPAPADDVPDMTNAQSPVAAPIQTLIQGDAFAPPPASLVFLGLVLYVVVVGPLDWLVLRKMKKERWTTVTFVSSVAAFTLIAYVASLFLFGAEKQTNRVVIVQLADGARPGRELVRIRDVAGYYLPLGGTSKLAMPSPGVFFGGHFPGQNYEMAGVGATLNMTVSGSDPLAGTAEANIAFRSQRIVSSLQISTTGRTLSVTAEGTGNARRFTLTNGLPVHLVAAYLVLPRGPVRRFGGVLPGATAVDGTANSGNLPSRGDPSARFRQWDQEEAVDAPGTLIGTAAPWAYPEYPAPEGFYALRRSGVSARRPEGTRALLVAYAIESPYPLADSEPGMQYVVITREVEIK